MGRPCVVVSKVAGVFQRFLLNPGLSQIQIHLSLIGLVSEIAR